MNDHVLRAVTEDGSFRVIALRTSETARGVADSQKARGETGRVLGELVTATVLVRELMSPDMRVQGILTADDRRSRIVSDARPDGTSRGLVQIANGASFTLGPRARLEMMRSLHNGTLQQGVVAIPPSGKVSDATMAYLQSSEQLVCVASIATSLVTSGPDAGTIAHAGGWVVQLLPEASRSMLEVMHARLSDFPSLESQLGTPAAEPRTLLEEILYGMPYGETGASNLRFSCGCSEDRLMASLATIAKNDLEEMITAGDILDIACEYCGKKYPISPEKLRALVTEN